MCAYARVNTRVHAWRESGVRGPHTPQPGMFSRTDRCADLLCSHVLAGRLMADCLAMRGREGERGDTVKPCGIGRAVGGCIVLATGTRRTLPPTACPPLVCACAAPCPLCTYVRGRAEERGG